MFLAKLLGPFLVKIGEKALSYALNYLEKKYPFSKPLIEMILNYLEGAKRDGNSLAVSDLHAHIASFLDRDK